MNTLSQTDIVAKIKSGEPRIDSRLIATGLNVEHRHLIALVDKYLEELSTFGIMRFENAKIGQARGRPVRLVYLNESQCYLLVTLSKNTVPAVRLKVALVKTFEAAREAFAATTDYLPSYREAHDNLAQLLRLNDSSVPDSVHHTNLERMINKALGIPIGSRKHLPPATRSAIAVAERIASVAYEQALQAGLNHKLGYQKAKADVLRYADTVVPTLPVLESAA
jgi:phage regulator Rha-like protein